MTSSALAITGFSTWPPAIAAAGPKAWHAILQFFAAEIRNPNTRRAYLRAAQDFFTFAAKRKGGHQLETISSLHIAAWLEAMAAAGLSVSLTMVVEGGDGAA